MRQAAPSTLLLLLVAVAVAATVAVAQPFYPMFTLWNTNPTVTQGSVLLQAQSLPNANALYVAGSTQNPLQGIDMTLGTLVSKWTASFTALSQQAMGAYSYREQFVAWCSVEAFAVNATSGAKQWTLALASTGTTLNSVYTVSDAFVVIWATDSNTRAYLGLVATPAASQLGRFTCPANQSRGVLSVVQVVGQPDLFVVQCDCGIDFGCNVKYIVQVNAASSSITQVALIGNQWSQWNCPPYGAGNVVVMSLTDLSNFNQYSYLVAIDVTMPGVNQSVQLSSSMSVLAPLPGSLNAFGLREESSSGLSVLELITIPVLTPSVTRFPFGLTSSQFMIATSPDSQGCVTLSSNSNDGSASVWLACHNGTYSLPCSFAGDVVQVVRPPAMVDNQFTATYAAVVNARPSVYTFQFVTWNSSVLCTARKYYTVPQDSTNAGNSPQVAQIAAVSSDLVALQRSAWADPVDQSAAWITQQPWLLLTSDRRVLLVHDAFAQPIWESAALPAPTTYNIATDLTMPSQPTFNVGTTAPIDPAASLQMLHNENFYGANAKKAFGLKGLDGTQRFSASTSQSVAGQACVAGNYYFIQGTFAIFAVERWNPQAQNDNHLINRPFDNGVHEIVPPVPNNGAMSTLSCINGAAYFTTGADVAYRIDGITREVQSSPSFCSFYPSWSTLRPQPGQACAVTVSGPVTQCGSNAMIMASVLGAKVLWSIPTDGSFTTTAAWNHTFDVSNTGDTSTGTPYCYSTRLFFVGTHHVTSLRLADGQVDWTYFNSAITFTPTTAIPFYDSLFVLTTNGYLISFYLEVHNPQIRWTEDAPMSTISNAVIAPNGQVILTGSAVASLDYRNGRALWISGVADPYLKSCGTAGFPGVIRNGLLYSICATASDSKYVLATFDVSLGTRWLTSAVFLMDTGSSPLGVQLLAPYFTIATLYEGETQAITLGLTAELLRADQAPPSVGTFDIPDPPQDESSNAGVIAGAILGSGAGIAAIAALAVFKLRGKGSSRVDLTDDGQSLAATSRSAPAPPPPLPLYAGGDREPLLGSRPSNANFGTADTYASSPVEREERPLTPPAAAAVAAGDAASTDVHNDASLPPPAFGNEA